MWIFHGLVNAMEHLTTLCGDGISTNPTAMSLLQMRPKFGLIGSTTTTTSTGDHLSDKVQSTKNHLAEQIQVCEQIINFKRVHVNDTKLRLLRRISELEKLDDAKSKVPFYYNLYKTNRSKLDLKVAKLLTTISFTKRAEIRMIHQLTTLEHLLENITSAEFNVRYYDAIKVGRDTLKLQNELLTVEDVENILLDTEEQIEQTEQIAASLTGESFVLSSSSHFTIDGTEETEALERELELLMKENDTGNNAGDMGKLSTGIVTELKIGHHERKKEFAL